MEKWIIGPWYGFSLSFKDSFPYTFYVNAEVIVHFLLQSSLLFNAMLSFSPCFSSAELYCTNFRDKLRDIIRIRSLIWTYGYMHTAECPV
jgi:hypothetical protein